MNFSLTVERNDLDDADGDLPPFSTISMIIKLEGHEISRSDYVPMKVDGATFITCDAGVPITLGRFNQFIENIEQNEYSVIRFNNLNGENSIVFSNGEFIFTNTYYECFLQVTIPTNQDSKNNFIAGFREFLEHVRSICNI